MRIRTHQILLFLIFTFCIFFVSVSGFKWVPFGNNEGFFPNINNEERIPFSGAVETSRKKKKHRLALNMMLGIFMIKAILLPLVFKAMLVMSGVSVIMSTFSLIVSSLMGYSKLAWKHAGPTIKIIKNSHGWPQDDDEIKGCCGKYEPIPEVKVFENDVLEHYHYYQK